MKQNSNTKSVQNWNWLSHRLAAAGARAATKAKATGAFLAALGVLAASPQAGQAALLSYEGFNYSAGGGNLTGLNGGFGWNGSWTGVNNGSSSVQSGSMVAGANAPTGYDALSTGNSCFTPNNTRTGRRLDTSAGGSLGVAGYIDGNGNVGTDGKTVYLSFMQQPNGTDVYYEFEFHRGDLGDPGRIGGIGNDSGGNNVNLRAPNGTQTTIGAGNSGVNFYVVRIDFKSGNDDVFVYRNVTSATEPLTPTLVVSNAADMSFNGFSFGCFNNGRTAAHDEVRVGESWADVVSPAGAFSAGNWDGGGANNNWSTGGNWDNDVVPVFASALTFAGSTRLNNTNNLTGVSANSITFDSAAGAFTLNGNSLGLNGNIGFSANPASPVTQTINLPLAPSRNFLVNARPNGNVTINGDISGAGVVELTQQNPDGNSGIVTLAGNNSLKGMVINNGTNRITGTTTINGIGGSSFFYLGDGQSSRKATLIIEPGANLTVSGPFQDAAVLGRDGGSGTIIQNGGTFNFNINDGSHEFLFVAASGNSATRGEYDMNGGLFDMNGKTLGVGLSAANLVTGIVNQVSGVITNVGNLRFNPFVQSGIGIYNLTGGSLYIGSGGITVDGGAYQMNLGGGTLSAVSGWSSSVNMSLTGIGGVTTINPNGNIITLSGILSGAAGLTVNGAGTLILNGANNYTGNTTITSGSTLEFDNTGSCPTSIRIANGGTLNLNFSGNYVVSSLYTNGVLLAAGTYNAGNLPGFITGSGNLQVSSISSGIWDGGGANNNWSSGGNWDNDVAPIFPHAVTFAGGARLNNNNDLSGITISTLTFDAAAGAFTLGGNDVTLTGGIGFNGNPASPVTHTVNLNLTVNSDQNIDTPSNGNLTLGGNITSAPNNLTKTSGGTLTLGGTDNFRSLILNNGTTRITGSLTATGNGGDSRFVLANASTAFNSTLIIEPSATLSISGFWTDSGVLGRDGGIATVTQNGGLFSFNMANQGFLFIGASGNPNTRSTYNLNGGTLDMNGLTLGVALGANVTVTGIVNQVAGTIDNVGQLYFSPFFSQGVGIYNFTGGRINIGAGGVIAFGGSSYQMNLGGGTVGALAGWSSSINMNLTGSNGPVSFDTAGNTVTLTGILSGPGGLNVIGGGTLDLGGADTYNGNTTVNASTLQFDVATVSAGTLRVTNGATLLLNHFSTNIVGGFMTNGVALGNGVYTAADLPGVINGSGALQVVGAVSTGVWDGGGANNLWSTGGNWDNNAVPVFPHDLTFSGSTRLNNTNDLSSLTISVLTFDAAAGAFSLNGNDVTLTGNIGFNGNPAAPITQTANLNMTWSADKTIDLPANGTLALNGNITTSANNLTKVGAGTLTFGGTDNFRSFMINHGTNRITGNVSVVGTGGDSRFVLANANIAFNSTLIIEPGATFSVSGDWTDAGVIGRDGGIGTITQNGGLFDFNMNNQNFLFVAATGNANTRGTYNLNGGVLDMHGKTLGIALGAGVNITGVVNQVSGVITNCGQLFMNPFFVEGRGTYNLTGGKIYLGSGGVIAQGGSTYQINLGGGTVGASVNWSSAVNMTLTGTGGSTTFDTTGGNITLSGALSGSGGLNVAGSGTLELGGANSYFGITLVNQGTLKLDSTNNRATTIKLANSTMLNLNYTGTMVVTNGFYTNNVALGAGTYNAGNSPTFITGSGSLTIPGGNPSVVNAPVISGGNLILTGSGGTPGNGYTWLSTTNLATPLASWIAGVTGTFDGSGNFSNAIPVNATTPAVFFRLRTP